MNSISILGCGWLGLPLGKHLAQAGFTVKGSTTSQSKVDLIGKGGISPYCFRLNPDIEGNSTGFFDSSILLINLPPRNRNGIASFHEEQLKSVRQEAMGKIKHVIFISSTAVYPSNNTEVIESDALNSCLTRGGIPLLDMERLFISSPEFKTTVIRFGGLYGPERHPGRFLAGKKDLAGADNPVNMIHLDDCIGVIQGIIKQSIWGKVLNACSPSSETRKSFYESAADELGIESPTFSDQQAPFKKVNVDRLIRLTGYSFKH